MVASLGADWTCVNLVYLNTLNFFCLFPANSSDAM